jgi:hypothetical protein
MKRGIYLAVLVATVLGAVSVLSGEAQTAISVDGLVESTSGGFMFPDGSQQSSAAPHEGEPVQVRGSCTMNDGDFFTSETIYSVPSGKRLEIELVNLVALNLAASEVLLPIINTTGGGVFNDFYLGEIDGAVCKTYPAFPDLLCAGSSTNVRLYADPGTSVVCKSFSTHDVGDIRTLGMFITGRLLDVAP